MLGTAYLVYHVYACRGLYWNGQHLFVHQLWEFICEGLTLSGCPRHVGRNYVPLFGVDTDLRHYVIRDVIVI